MAGKKSLPFWKSSWGVNEFGVLEYFFSSNSSSRSTPSSVLPRDAGEGKRWGLLRRKWRSICAR
jgi:hypothetical protein